MFPSAALQKPGHYLVAPTENHQLSQNPH